MIIKPIKKIIKKAIGHHGVALAHQVKGQFQYLRCKASNYVGTVQVQDCLWDEPIVYSQPLKHVFFGYYDLQQINTAQDKMLVTVLPKNADVKRSDAELGWYNIADGQYHPFTVTAAWCWQQGARLRWHPQEQDIVLYNDIEIDRYVTRAFNLKTKKKMLLADRACYDITTDMRYGLSLNYSRLQRLRPGYGYGKLLDKTSSEKVPAQDGIFLVNLASGESKLLVSYEQLVKLSPDSEKKWNYINHISIAPDGSKFMFFHLWTPGVDERWRAKLYVADMNGSGLRCLEEQYDTSHYCWRDSNTLLTTTCAFDGGRSCYMIYDLESGRRVSLTRAYLTNDGHPSWLNDGEHFIADTYPLEHCMQHMFSTSVSGEDYVPICDFFSDPRMFGEKRCDLHPRITKDNKILTVDSTFQSGLRSVVMFRRRDK